MAKATFTHLNRDAVHEKLNGADVLVPINLNWTRLDSNGTECAIAPDADGGLTTIQRRVKRRQCPDHNTVQVKFGNGEWHDYNDRKIEVWLPARVIFNLTFHGSAKLAVSDNNPDYFELDMRGSARYPSSSY